MKQLTLTHYNDIMQSYWFVLSEYKGSTFNTGAMMTGYAMLDAIYEAPSWDTAEVCDEDEDVTAKDLLITLCKLFEIETEEAETYDDLYNTLYEIIENVTN